MADGVKIRIVGDDSEFIRTLEGLEQRAQAAFRGVGSRSGNLLSGVMAQLPQLSGRLQQMLGGRLTMGLDLDGTMVEGLRSQKEMMLAEASRMAKAAQSALNDAGGAQAAGAAMGSAYQRGLNSRRAAIIATANSIARAAAQALRGQNSVQSSVNTGGGQRSIGMTARSVISGAQIPMQPVQMSVRMPQAAQEMPRPVAPQKIYLNVDGKTLAQVIGGDVRAELGRRNRSIDLGVGR